MNNNVRRFVGLDPGGDGQFGWCVVTGCDCPLSLAHSGCAGDAAAAVRSVLEVLGSSPEVHAVGIDSPMFWSPTGARRVDRIVREALKEAGAPNAGGTVQQVNSLRGACLTQGVVAAHLIRQAFPDVRITEAHPKALLWLIKVAAADRRVSQVTMGHLAEFISCEVGALSEHERDAALGALAAWAMVSRAPGWRDIAHEDRDCFVPVPPVEYWMPIAGLEASMEFSSRNHALGFAERTRKNLQAIEEAALMGKDVHVVTQVATSLLGLVAFPWEKQFASTVEKLPLSDLVEHGWPQWDISLGCCHTLGELAHCMRNAIAHGHLAFSSESRVLTEVDVTLEDYRPKATKPHWRGSIRCDQLREFCLRFIDLVEKTVG